MLKEKSMGSVSGMSSDGQALPNHLHKEVVVTKFIHALCIPAHIIGYHYLRESILIAIRSRETLGAKELFKQVAAAYDTTPAKVDNGIRYALRLAWNRCNFSLAQKEYDFISPFAFEKPTSMEFIARVADHFKLLYGLHSR